MSHLISDKEVHHQKSVGQLRDTSEHSRSSGGVASAASSSNKEDLEIGASLQAEKMNKKRNGGKRATKPGAEAVHSKFEDGPNLSDIDDDDHPKLEIASATHPDEGELGMQKKKLSGVSQKGPDRAAPGAERIDGINNTVTLEHMGATSPDSVQGYSRPPQDAAGYDANGNLIAATVVDADEERRQIRDQVHSEYRQNAPVASVVKEQPWYKRRLTWILIFGVLAIAGIVTGVVVGTRNNDSKTVEATPSPTTSPAPTAMGEVTIVMQLDAKKGETGWKLECDSGVVEEVPPGSYAFIGSNHFRVEYLAEVVEGDECSLTIQDTGGDGIENGFFEVYYGSDINSQDLRLVSGFINPTESTTKFMAQIPDGVAPPSPTAAPGPPPPVGVSQVCTVCADGAAVNPFASAKNWNNINCAALENFAALQNVTTCREIQDSAAYDCGCTNFCTTICPDRVTGPSEDALDNVVLTRGVQEVTCGDFQNEIVASGKNDLEKCLFANLIGEDVCGCQPTEKRCRLCQGDVIPPANSSNIEVIPGLRCRDISGLAYTLRAADPSGVFFEVCPSCLAIGVYCGCPLPSLEEGGQDFCRICGDNVQDLLPDPARIINSTTMDQTTTCFHVEFVANLNSTTPEGCRAHQEDARERCCSPKAEE